MTDVDGASFVNVGDARDQSALYQSLGDNAYLRDDEGFAFSAPADFAPCIVEASVAQRQLASESEAYRARVERFVDEGTL